MSDRKTKFFSAFFIILWMNLLNLATSAQDISSLLNRNIHLSTLQIFFGIYELTTPELLNLEPCLSKMIITWLQALWCVNRKDNSTATK